MVAFLILKDSSHEDLALHDIPLTFFNCSKHSTSPNKVIITLPNSHVVMHHTLTFTQIIIFVIVLTFTSMCIINVLCSMIISVISSVYADDTPLSPTLTQEQLSAEERRLNRIVNRPSKVIIMNYL